LSDGEKFLEDFENFFEEVLKIANFMCKWFPKIMEGTALVGGEEAEPFEAAAEADCKIFEKAEKEVKLIWNTVAGVIHSINDAEACAEEKASSHTFALYTGTTWGRKYGGDIVYPNWRIG
jgi:hypothetical protein